ncbi:hypothetical protein [Streptomyces caelestis]|uniref:Uncharacterized protein n=1 Tax=Streptomyces caelestis TaxID=36816 RepID=A0A7W9GY84_9ACTN|nr:hypothetical protein [Streptomyces caelestis]MBB5792202.1 hypothetical protein [Streptomyces caelestis]
MVKSRSETVLSSRRSPAACVREKTWSSSSVSSPASAQTRAPRCRMGAWVPVAVAGSWTAPEAGASAAAGRDG